LQSHQQHQQREDLHLTRFRTQSAALETIFSSIPAPLRLCFCWEEMHFATHRAAVESGGNRVPPLSVRASAKKRRESRTEAKRALWASTFCGLTDTSGPDWPHDELFKRKLAALIDLSHLTMHPPSPTSKRPLFQNHHKCPVFHILNGAH
jgi:hypothetical protein